MALLLPSPATATELYLAAILEELRTIRALLQAAGAAADQAPAPDQAAPGTELVETASAATATNKPRGTRRR